MADFLLTDLRSDAAKPLYEWEYDKSIRAFVDRCRKTGSHELSQADDGDGNSILRLLDPARNTIAYLFVLLAHSDQSNKSKVSSDELLIAISEFLTSFDPVQARYVGHEWRNLIQWVDGIIAQTHNPQLIIPLRTAILRMDPSSSTFTSNHVLLVQLCIEAGWPRQALPILDKDIFALPTDPIKNIEERYPCGDHDLSCAYITMSSAISGEVKAYDLQEYYSLGAHIYIGLRNYERARLFLELVLAVPSTNNGVNFFMLEAYRRLNLVGLLAQGHAFKSSHMLDQQSTKTIQQLSRPYDALAEAFKNRDLQKFNAEVDVGAALWQEDGNTGIVHEVAASLRRYLVIDLQQTYSALPITSVATRLSSSVPNTQSFLITMIRDGFLNATITQSHDSTTTNGTTGGTNAVLRFDSHTSGQSAVTDAHLDTLLQASSKRIEALSAHVKEADRKLAISREYNDWLRKSQKLNGNPAAFEDPMEMNWEPPSNNDAEYEDLMADLKT